MKYFFIFVSLSIKCCLNGLVYKSEIYESLIILPITLILKEVKIKENEKSNISIKLNENELICDMCCCFYKSGETNVVVVLINVLINESFNFEDKYEILMEIEATQINTIIYSKIKYFEENDELSSKIVLFHFCNKEYLVLQNFYPQGKKFITLFGIKENKDNFILNVSLYKKDLRVLENKDIYAYYKYIRDREDIIFLFLSLNGTIYRTKPFKSTDALNFIRFLFNSYIPLLI